MNPKPSAVLHDIGWSETLCKRILDVLDALKNEVCCKDDKRKDEP